MNTVKPILLVMLSFIIVLVSACNWATTKYSTVAELLDDPVYDKDVRVEGVISLLGELFCPCFHLSSGGKVIEVWYGLMIEDDSTQWDDVSVEGLNNGDTVVVTGHLKQKGLHSSLNDFWAKDIEKKNSGEVNNTIINAEEALETVMQYLSEQGTQVLPAVSAGWQQEDITPDGILGGSTIRYWHEEWTITIQYPIVLPQNTVYQVVVLGGPYTGWYWKGSVNYYGDIAEYLPFGKLTVDTSREIARDFVINSPTFKFDGILDTLVLTETITLRCPYCWQFVFEFDSRHSGYGDRTGQVLLEVITHHRAVVTVDNGQVSYAIIDRCWYMLEQELIPPI